MTQPFETKVLSIRELLTSPMPYYKIPNYQRPYKWTDNEVEQLWEDIQEAYEDEEKNYFLGSIITADSDNPNYKNVIDGQQRLTTLIILCCVIRDIYPDIKSTKEFSVTNTTIMSAIFHEGKEEGKTKFRTQDTSQTDFEKHIVKADATINLKKPTPKELKSDKSEYKFINSAIILREKLKKLRKELRDELGNELGDEKSAGFVDFLFDCVNIIKINCEKDTSAIRIFQVINARGMDLTHSDLIKSFLLEGIEEQTQFIGDWNKMEEDAAECGDNMENMFTVYAYYALAKNPAKGLYEELRKDFANRFTNHNLSEIMPELKEFFSNYKNKIYKDEDEITYSFWYLPWGVYWKSILLSALQHGYCADSDNYRKLAKAIRRFYYLYWIGGRTISKVKQTSFNVIQEIRRGTPKEGIPVEHIEELLNKQIKKDVIIADATHRLNSDDIASERWCKPLLLLVEYNAIDKPSYIKLDKELHLEHVLPVQYKREEWDIDDEVVKKYLQSAGNITLLSGKKNIIASNKSFHEKINTYRWGNDQKTTAFRITQKILDDYNHATYEKQWTEDSMRDRKKWFLKEVGKILDIKINLNSN